MVAVAEAAFCRTSVAVRAAWRAFASWAWRARAAPCGVEVVPPSLARRATSGAVAAGSRGLWLTRLTLEARTGRAREDSTTAGRDDPALLVARASIGTGGTRAGTDGADASGDDPSTEPKTESAPLVPGTALSTPHQFAVASTWSSHSEVTA